MTAPPPFKARRRPGPWKPIEPTFETCKTFYTDALCSDVASWEREEGQRLKGISKLKLLTPRQRCKVSGGSGDD